VVTRNESLKEHLMKVTVDQNKCVSAGQCVLAADDVFDQREEDGVVVLLNSNPPRERVDDLRQAATLCPSGAITVED
jgi:ferredoxin